MSKHILLCDDEIHILRAAEYKLQRAGYRTQLAHDGEEAWEAIVRERPDLLISDCQMPRLDGLGLAQRLRDNEDTHGLPIIMLSAKGLELDPQTLAERWNILELVHKPFSPRELLNLVDRILQAQPV